MSVTSRLSFFMIPFVSSVDDSEDHGGARNAAAAEFAAPVDRALEELQKKLTREGRLDDAVEVKSFRQKFQSGELEFSAPSAE
jgi:hypothetical protein